jgi:hypothetical protein
MLMTVEHTGYGLSKGGLVEKAFYVQAGLYNGLSIS